MGQYYKDADHLYEIYGYFLDKVLRDRPHRPEDAQGQDHNPFHLHRPPRAKWTIDLRNPPKARHVRHLLSGDRAILRRMSGPSRVPTIRTVSGTAWSIPLPRSPGGMSSKGGKVTAMLKLLPVVRPFFKSFPGVLEELGYQDLILKG